MLGVSPFFFLLFTHYCPFFLQNNSTPHFLKLVKLVPKRFCFFLIVNVFFLHNPTIPNLFCVICLLSISFLTGECKHFEKHGISRTLSVYQKLNKGEVSLMISSNLFFLQNDTSTSDVHLLLETDSHSKLGKRKCFHQYYKDIAS